MTGVTLIAVIIAGLVLAAVIFAVFAKIYVGISYLSGNSTPAKNGLTGEQTAALLLERLDIQNVQVKKLSWFASIIYGNHYNARKKTIYLRANIYNKSTVTSVGLATQKVGLVMQHVNGEKKFKVKAALQPFIILAPILFVPLSVLGVILDFVLFRNIGVLTLVFIAFGFLFYLAAFIFTLMSIPVEKKANKFAMEAIEKSNILEGSEQEKVRKIYKAYIISYVADFIMSVLYLLKYILKIVNLGAKKGRK